MSLPASVQAARKDMQLARLDKKDTDLEDYPAYYAAQPLQVERAALNQKFKDAKQDLREAAEVLAVARVRGVGLEDAVDAHAVAAKVVEMARPPSNNERARASLGGGL